MTGHIANGVIESSIFGNLNSRVQNEKRNKIKWNKKEKIHKNNLRNMKMNWKDLKSESEPYKQIIRDK